jgi:hypothetical protein
MGILSYQRMPVPQEGQEEGGNTTDLPSGRRQIQTFKKEPTTAPKRNAKM